MRGANVLCAAAGRGRESGFGQRNVATVAVSPNRMELLRMKKKQQFAQRGHKLLKDKLVGLLKDFTRIVQEYAVLRAQVDSELGELFQQFIVASASMPAEVYRSALAFPECEADLTMTEKLIMNVRVPVFAFAIEGNLLSYGTDGTVVYLDQAIVKLKEVLERLVKLAEAEKTIELVADEIEKTRRRVNALGIDWHDLFDIIVAEGLFEVESTWKALRDMEEHDLLERAMKKRLGWEDVRDLLVQEDREDVIDIVIDGFLALDGFDLVMELIKADGDLLYGALVAHYGGNAGLFASLWHSRKPLDEVDPVELSVHSDVTEGKVATWAYVEDRMRNWY